jgi:muconate cycloisomerase
MTRRQILAGSALAGFPAAGQIKGLRITRVELFQVVVPMQPDIINSPEFGKDALTEFPSIPKFIVKAHTEAAVGIGETSRGLAEAAVRKNAQFLEGKNILDLNLTRLGLPTGAGYSGFEMALYDVVGKAVGWPVWRLLGGLAQPKVLVNYWCGRKTAADMRRVAERAVKGKFQGIKIKGRPGDPVVKAVEAIAAVDPKLKVTVDFNGYHKTVEEFLPIGQGLDAIGNILVLEDPINKSDLAGYRELRRRLKSPIALHLGNPKQMLQAIAAEACTIFNTGPNPSMASFLHNSYLAGAAGMPVWHGSGHELGVFDAAMLHSCAAAANCTLPSDILSHQRVDDLIVRPIEMRDSHAIVPDRPGLGVELDEEAVRRYAARG